MATVTEQTSGQVSHNSNHQDTFEQVDINSAAPSLSRPLAIGSGEIKIGGKTEKFDYEVGAPKDGVAKIEVNATPGQELSAPARFFSTVGAAVTGYLKKLAIAAPAAAAGLGLVGTTEKADAALMLAGTNDADYRAMGAEMAGKLLWVEGVGGVTGSQISQSAVRLNSEYALTAAHGLGAFGSATPNILTNVGNGTNFYTDRGTVIPIASVKVYPGYDGTFFTPDLAIIHFSMSLAGDDLTIGSVNEGDVIEAAGFGRPGYPGSPTLPQDGFSRGWQARALPGVVDANVSETYYIGAIFGEFNQGLALNGRGTPGDSGGPWFNTSGELVGISIAVSGGTDTVGTTDVLNLAQPEIHSWLMQNTSAVPEPSSFVLLMGAVGIGGLLVTRRR